MIGEFDCRRYPHYDQRLPPVITWIRCGRCAHVHTKSFWSAEGLGILLAKTHTTQLADSKFDEKRLVWASTVQQVLALLPTPEAAFSQGAAWLDVGCGDGSLVMTAAEFGFDAAGLDTRLATVQKLTSLGYKAFQGDFLAFNLPKPLDVISLADVLEHFAYPIAALRKAHALLRPGGLLCVSCPNMDSISWRHMDAARTNAYWIEMEHHHNFSRRLLMNILREMGFKPERYSVSQRYQAGMEIIAMRVGDAPGQSV